MRKPVLVLALVFAVAFGFGIATTDTAEAAGGGGGGSLDCFYTCDCAGNPLYCCTSSSGTSCKPTTVISCPQVYNC